MAEVEVVVVGGGVIGVSTAYYLAKRRKRVLLLEQADELCWGSSRGNAGQITPGHLPLPQPGTLQRNLRWLLLPTSPLYIPLRYDPALWHWLLLFLRASSRRHLLQSTRVLCQLGRLSFELFRQLAAELDFGYQCRGRLEVCRTGRTLGAAVGEAELLNRFGFGYELLDGKQLRQREPAIEADVAGAIYMPDSAHCNPHRFVLELARAAEGMGVEIRLGIAVCSVLQRGGEVVVATGRGEHVARWAVVASGAWPPPLPAAISRRLPLQPGKGYHLDVVPVAAQSPRIPLILLQERIFVAPIDDFLRMAGTMELSGFDLSDNPVRVRMLAEGTCRYMPAIKQAQMRSRWWHLRPLLPDGLPAIGPVPGAEKIWLATGHGMLGLSQGPGTGYLIAEGIDTGRTSIDLTAVRLDRFPA